MPATRQLTAILFADIQGYTALMQEDEANARSIRDKFKKELEIEAPIHQGRIVQFSGDGALCIFNSAIEAVRAAIGIQKRMQQEPKVPLRIGIHSGDVMFEEENIYGDGVNIASRIESFAVPGSVFISGKVPIVHTTVAYYKSEGERDLEGALAELDIADRMLHSDKQTMQMRADILRRMGRMNEALALFKKLAEIYPKEMNVQIDVAYMYYRMRDFDRALPYVNKLIELSPDHVGMYYFKLSLYTDLKGDLKTPYIILHDASSLVDSNDLQDAYLTLDELTGNYASAIQKLSGRIDSLDQTEAYNVIPNSILMAIMYNNMGDHKNAKKYFQRSLEIMSHLVEQHPDDYRLLSSLGIAYAGLNEKEKALEQGNKAVEMMPVSKDLYGLGPLESLALIHTLLGDQDEAIDILERLLKFPFAWGLSNTIPLYRNYLYWKPLQNNPRFQKMIQ